MDISKEIKNAINDVLASRIDSANNGMMSTHRASIRSYNTLHCNGITITGKMSVNDEVIQNGKPIAKITYKYASRKVNGMYKMLKPKVEFF